MLSIYDLLIQDSYPQLTDVSLRLYCEFARAFLVNRRFIYDFFDGDTIIVEFKEYGIHHMLGIHHIDRSIDKNKFFQTVDSGLDLSAFEINYRINQRFKDNKPRIRMFSCIYRTLLLGEFFYCPSETVKNTDNVKMDYIIYRKISNKGCNIGLRKTREDQTYIPLTLLVARQVDPELYIDRSKIKIVKRMRIEDMNTGVTIENIVHGDDYITFL